jgi:hypothetical protein
MYSDFGVFFATLLGLFLALFLGGMIGYGHGSNEPIIFSKIQQCMELCTPNSEVKYLNLVNVCCCNNGAEFRMKD